MRAFHQPAHPVTICQCHCDCMAICFAKSAKCAKLANMAKVVNVHKIDGETFYLVRLTPQEVRPVLPDGLDAEALPEGQVFMPRERDSVFEVAPRWEQPDAVFSTQAKAEAAATDDGMGWARHEVK